MALKANIPLPIGGKRYARGDILPDDLPEQVALKFLRRGWVDHVETVDPAPDPSVDAEPAAEPAEEPASEPLPPAEPDPAPEPTPEPSAAPEEALDLSRLTRSKLRMIAAEREISFSKDTSKAELLALLTDADPEGTSEEE